MSLRQMLQPSSSPPSHLDPQTSPSHRHLPAPWDHIRTRKASTSSHSPDRNEHDFPYPAPEPIYNAYGESPFYRPVDLNPNPNGPPGSQILQSLYTVSTPDHERPALPEQPALHDTLDDLDDHSIGTSFSDLEEWDDLDTTFGYYVPHGTSTNTSQSTSATIDLTQDPESPPIMPSQVPRKRRASQQLRSSPNERSTKRQKPSGSSASTSQETGQEKSTLPSRIEEIDLADDEDEVAVVLQKQREEQVLAQYSKGGRKKSKLCELSCAVCMEPPTDLTATVCGHYFCRDCLLRWLAASEKEGPRKSNCPSCRKPISRTKKNDVIPLEIMTIKAKTRK